MTIITQNNNESVISFKIRVLLLDKTESIPSRSMKKLCLSAVNF